MANLLPLYVTSHGCTRRCPRGCVCSTAIRKERGGDAGLQLGEFEDGAIVRSEAFEWLYNTLCSIQLLGTDAPLRIGPEFQAAG
jgi:hypothetical protein